MQLSAGNASGNKQAHSGEVQGVQAHGNFKTSSEGLTCTIAKTIVSGSENIQRNFS